MLKYRLQLGMQLIVNVTAEPAVAFTLLPGYTLHTGGAVMVNISVVPGILRTPLTLPLPSITYPYVSLSTHPPTPYSTITQLILLFNGAVVVILRMTVVVFTAIGTILEPKA